MLTKLVMSLLITLPITAALGVAAPDSSVDQKEDAAMSVQEAQQQGPPQPGPEHALLKAHIGAWDLVMTPGPGAPFPPMTGVETCALSHGGFWLVSDIKAEAPDKTPFTGHGLTGYDQIRKKFVSVWVDSSSSSLMQSEGASERGGKVLALSGEHLDAMSGKPVRTRTVTEVKDENTRTFTMYAPGPDGKEGVVMTINYRRRK